jgi:carboxypeptidase Taq
MDEYLGVNPPNDAKGVLQDIHWAMGNFGYFPTYSLGSMIAVQLFAAADEDIDDLMEKIASGDYDALHLWLRRHVWQHGRRFSTKEVVRRATGEELSSAPYIAHLRRRYE